MSEKKRVAKDPAAAKARERLFGETAEPEEPKAKLIKGTYPFGLVTSAMQKEIRKGDERAAMFWGHLLYQTSPYYAWKRVLVTAAEDIGLAAPQVVGQVCSLAVAWRLSKERSFYVSPHHFSMAVILLCRAPKSTEVEDLQTITLERIKAGERPDVPAYAKDAHTKEGKAAGKTWRHWYMDRHGVCGVPVNPYTEQLWRVKPEWDPRGA